jgi:hypothetical protein
MTEIYYHLLVLSISFYETPTEVQQVQTIALLSFLWLQFQQNYIKFCPTQIDLSDNTCSARQIPV